MPRQKTLKIYFPHGRHAPGKTWAQMSGKERWVTSRRIIGGRHRAAFWRELGFPNLERAWEARKRACERRRRLGITGRGKTLTQPRVREIQRDELLRRNLLPAGLYDPEYLMRREMLILDAQRRSPRNYP